jgi:tetratricopeptide (TPR) repeat protein
MPDCSSQEWNQPEAEAAFRAASVINERLVAQFPGQPEYAVSLGGSYCNLGNVLVFRGARAEALEFFAKAIAVLEPAYAINPRLLNARVSTRNSHRGRAFALTRLGRAVEALQDWERALELDEGPGAISLRLGLADALVRTGETAKARATADEFVTAPNLSAEDLCNLACVYILAGAAAPPHEAEANATRAVELLRRAAAKDRHKFAQFIQDPALNSLRSRPAFVDLVWDFADLPRP